MFKLFSLLTTSSLILCSSVSFASLSEEPKRCSDKFQPWCSDRNLKTNIEAIQSPIEKIRTIQGVRYQLKGSDQTEFGFIAQDLQLIYPEMVRDDSQSGYLRVDYRSMIPVLLEAIKEQQTRIDMLQSMFDESSNANLDAK